MFLPFGAVKPLDKATVVLTPRYSSNLLIYLHFCCCHSHPKPCKPSQQPPNYSLFLLFCWIRIFQNNPWQSMVLFLTPSLFLKIKPQVCTLVYKAFLVCPLQLPLFWFPLSSYISLPQAHQSTFLPQSLCNPCFLCPKGSLYTRYLQRWFLPILDVLGEILPPNKTLFVTSPGSFHCLFL